MEALVAARPSAVGILVAGCALTAFAAATFSVSAEQPAPAGQAPAAQGGRGGNNSLIFSAADADKDGSLTRAELKSVFEKWYDAADTARTGSITQEQLGTALTST